MKSLENWRKQGAAVIFDFDYTLGDSTSGIALSINYALEELGYASSDIADIRRTIGLSLTETYRALTGKDDIGEAEKFAGLFQKKADSVMVASATLYAGAKDILRKLKTQGYRTAIVTTKFHYRIEQILSKYDANGLVDVIVGAEDVKVEKPDPEGLLLAIERLGVEKSEVLYVGDSLVDAKTAQNAQVAFAAVLTGTTTRDDFGACDNVYTGEDISEVCRYISDLKERRF